MTDGPLIVNRDQLAQFLGCSLPTVDAIVKRYPDLPIIQRGAPGRQWQFDANAVRDFIQARKDEEEAVRAEKSELLAQFTLKMPGLEDQSGRPISLDDEIKAAKLRQLQRDEMKESGFLVPTHEIRVSLERLFRQLGRTYDSALDRAVREHHLPEALKRSLEQKFADARASLVRNAPEWLAAEDEQDDEQFSLRA